MDVRSKGVNDECNNNPGYMMTEDECFAFASQGGFVTEIVCSNFLLNEHWTL